MHLNTIICVLLALLSMITMALSIPSALSTRIIHNSGSAIFKGEYGGHSYEANGSIHVQSHPIPSRLILCLPRNGKSWLNSRSSTPKLSS
jgi:hypothetical protein